MIVINESVLEPVKRMPFSLDAAKGVVAGDFVRIPISLQGFSTLALSSADDSGMLVNFVFFALFKKKVFGPVIILEAGESV